MKGLKKMYILGVVLVVFYLIVGFYYNNVIDVIKFKVPELNGIKIVQISDLHFGKVREGELKNVVKKINDLQPDIVVFTGDLNYGSNDKFSSKLNDFSIKYLSSINCDIKLAVLGNHDLHNEDVLYVLDKSNFQLLINETYSYQDIDIFGFDSIYSYGYESHQKDFKYYINNFTRKTIVLSHEPDVFSLTKQSDKLLMHLSGHSHGGQVIFPIIGGQVFPKGSKVYGKKRHYQKDGKSLYVNFGFGNSLLNIRHYNKKSIYYFD